MILADFLLAGSTVLHIAKLQHTYVLQRLVGKAGRTAWDSSEQRKLIKFIYVFQGWGAGADRSRVFLAPWSRSRLKKQEPEPLGKKIKEPEPLKNQPAPQPCWKIRNIRKLYVVVRRSRKKNTRSRSRSRNHLGKKSGTGAA